MGDSNASQQVTDEELDRAAEVASAEPEAEAVEHEPETPPDPEVKEEIPPEPTDAAERSRMGRRIKQLEERLNQTLERLEQVTATPKDEHLTPEDYVKVEDIPKIISQLEQEKITQNSIYETKYLSKVAKIGIDNSIDDEFQDSVFAEMQSNYNTRVTGNPEIDAEINYHKAEAAVLRKKAGVITSPLKGGKPSAALGVGGGSSTTAKPVKPIKLSKEAADYAREMGMSDEQIHRALSKEVPPHLMGRR